MLTKKTGKKMKVLWICNLILPRIAGHLGISVIPKEGWVESLFNAIALGVDSDIVPNIAFPVDKRTFRKLGGDKKTGVITGKYEEKELSFTYYAFLENVRNESVYEDVLEERMRYIFECEKPDIVHAFGSEFPHTLAAARAIGDPGKFLIGLQGICEVYAEKYAAHMPPEIVARYTFRDRLKNDSIYRQQQKYFMRADNEREAIELAGHALGRTAFDKEFALGINPGIEYHHAGETLREPFYRGAWMKNTAERHRIFVSQADYPLKGFHYLLKAVGELIQENEELSDLELYVAGNSIVGYDSLVKKIKISSYGKYLIDLMREYDLSSRVHFLGRLNAEKMKEQLIKCDTFVCCSACENSPNSVGEAQMLQVPIVTSLVGGISSIFTPGEDGFSYDVEPEDTLESVSDKLKATLVERYEREKEGDFISEVDRRRHNAGFHARENHNPEKNVHDMIAIYRSICR